MINGISTNLNPIQITGAGASGSAAGTAGANGTFADALKNSIGEVSKLQQDATQAVQDLATGKNEDVTGVMTAVEKSDLAFKTLLAIRTKLMEAYDEIKGMSI
ncbi:MAG: flagellar hook-basal body complex protein FliE [Phycisphaerae bacterium]|nr:flagellar hook-basal body complex protein FliE [Phycisphaerae bacterium]